MKNLINKDLKFLCKWLQANNISLNTGKTDLIIFHHPNKHMHYDFKIKLNGKKLYSAKFIKYLGVLIDSHLNFSYHINSVATKLSRAIGMLTKIRHYVNVTTLRSIYFAIFSSNLSYASIIWGQVNNVHFKRIESLQNKAVKILNFANFRDTATPYYKTSHILKLRDNIRLQNFLYVHDDLSKNLPLSLRNTFQMSSSQHSHQTRNSMNYNVILPKARTTAYGLKSIKFQSSAEWNFFMKHFSHLKLYNKSKYFCKSKLYEYFLNCY